ncbi:hypothetical protein PRIEUP_LOCUS1916 [Pristimantis euphronides]
MCPQRIYIYISHGARLKRERSKKLKSLLEHLGQLEVTKGATPSDDLKVEIIATRQQILSILDQRALYQWDKMRKGFYEYGDKCGSWLARAIHPKSPQTHIFSTNSPGREVVHATVEIVDAFQAYYSNLYNIEQRDGDGRQKVEMEKYLAEFASPSLAEAEARALESGFTETELAGVIGDLKVGKSPSPDGFTLRFYKTDSDAPKNILYNFLEMPVSMFPPQATITVLPKLGKRPYSLW